MYEAKKVMEGLLCHEEEEIVEERGSRCQESSTGGDKDDSATMQKRKMPQQKDRWNWIDPYSVAIQYVGIEELNTKKAAYI